MAIVQSYDWESNTYTNHMPVDGPTDTMAEHQRWLDAVATTGEKARQALPQCDQRITKALALILDGHLSRQPDGSFMVKSQSRGSRKSYRVNGRCECPSGVKLVDGLCKHMIASMIYRRATSLLREGTQTTTHTAPEPEATDPQPAPEPSTPTPQVPAQHIVQIQGKPFVRYCGLLQMAHERGLVALTADWTYNDSELSLAHAVAVFTDGRRFEESGDASPQNCTKKVATHFRRVALTRAKARVLRDALGIDLVAVEELADE